MTDTSLVLMPLSTWTYRIAYSKNLMEGPTNTPSGYQFAKYNAVLAEYQRNDTDDITAAIDWKPVRGTMVTYEQQVTHYKGDSFFTLAANSLIAQEADGTPVAINNFDSLSPYGIGACNTASMGTAYTNATTYTIFSAPNPPGGQPIINPACAVVTDYLRSQPTRASIPDRGASPAEREPQEPVDQRKCALYQREHAPAQLLRQLSGLERGNTLADLYGECERDTPGSCRRPGRSVAGNKQLQPG